MATDDPDWCKTNLVDKEGKLQINVTHSYYRDRKKFVSQTYNVCHSTVVTMWHFHEQHFRSSI